MRKSLFIFIFCTFLYSDNDLIFLPDSGIRVDSCGISKVLVDPNGVYFLYYTQGPNNGVAVSNDGLNFTIDDPQNYPSYRYNFMPDSSYKHYFIDIVNDTALLKSRSSIDGFTFSLDSGNRFVFPTNDAITSTNVYSTFFNNILGEVYMIYLAGEIDNARSIKSESGNNGWNFGSYTANIFGDSVLGGGNQSYWDPNAIVLPDNRIRIFTMNQHGHPVPPAVPKGTIYSFTSINNGSTYIQDTDYRLRYDDFNEFEVLSLNDPKVILLPDGRYRMYVASMIRTGQGNEDIKWSIISATTSTTTVIQTKPQIPSIFYLFQNYPNPFNPITSLRYDLPENGLVNITIYDMMGSIVKTLINSSQTAGYKSIKWNATNNRNESVSAGLYLYTIQAGEFRQTKKMVLLK